MVKQILFDFDGVIIDSMDVRDYGFREIVKEHDKNLVEEFIKYHRYNAGLSRYVKIRYFYEEMLGQSITQEEVDRLALLFSNIMKNRLTTPDVLITETVSYIKSIYKDITLHIVSGSDEKELNFLCETLGLSQFFKTIEGSPTHKNDLVKNIMKEYRYQKEETILIGDSINDFDAAMVNNVSFYGYNNIDLKSKGSGYITKFKDFIFYGDNTQ